MAKADEPSREELETEIQQTEQEMVVVAEPEVEPEPQPGPTIVEPAEPPEPIEAEPSVEQLRGELENRKRALEEERERRKTTEKTLGQILDRFEQAQTVAHQRQVAPVEQEEMTPEEEYILNTVVKRMGPILQQHQQMYQTLTQGQQQQQLVGAWQMAADQYAKDNPDFVPAIKHMASNVAVKAQILFPDNQQAQQQYIMMQSQAAMQFEPSRLYDYITKTEGYKPGTPSQPPAVPGTPQSPPRVPKSLSNISGTSPSGTESMQARADKLLSANWQELLDVDGKTFDAVLKDMR